MYIYIYIVFGAADKCWITTAAILVPRSSWPLKFKSHNTIPM